MKTVNKENPILVTGASGYIASWVVKNLLDQGFTVHATVRNKQNQQRIEQLERLEQNSIGSLKLFEADLMRAGSFAEAMVGCEVVIHTASPFVLQVKNAQKQLIDPALRGTRNVLESVNETPSVKRVVLTSSVAAAYGDLADLETIPNKTLTEKNWNESSSIDHQPYSFSKTLAEREAWKINKEQKQWDLVVINPGFVMGPSLTKRTDSTSIDFMRSMANGKFRVGVPELNFGVVDVRDVALAHIQAALLPEAKGRHLIVSKAMSTLEMGQVLIDEFQTKYPFPKSYLPRFILYLFGPFQGFNWAYLRKNIGFPMRVDNSYSKKNLQMEYRPVEETLVDHLKQLERDGLL